MDPVAITFAILIVAVVAFMSNRIPVGIVAIGVALALWATGILTLPQALSGFGDPIVLFIAALFVVSEGLDSSGVTAWAGQKVIAQAGKSKKKLLVLVMLLVAVLTALISVNGAVAALLPVVVVVATRMGLAPSKMLLPLAFAAHAGSMLALTGTPVNIIVSDAAVDAGARPFGFFEFGLVGVPLVVGTLLITMLFGNRLLPERTAHQIPRDLSKHAKVLLRQYSLPEQLNRLRVRSRSSLIGKSQTQLELGGVAKLRLLSVQSRYGVAKNDEAIEADDVLVLRGPREEILAFATEAGLDLATDRASGNPDDSLLIDREVGVTEIVIPPRSSMVGMAVFPGMITESGDLVILAVQRNGEDRGIVETTLAVGDTLLLQGRWDALTEHTADPAVLVVDAPDQLRRQAAPMGARAWRSIAIVVAMVILLATGVVPSAVAGLLAASAMVLLRVVSVKQAYRSISWTTVVLVAGMIPLSTAFMETGAAQIIAHGLVEFVGDSGPHIALLSLCVLTMVLGQLISNTATVLIVAPVAVSVAYEMDVSVLPFLMGLTVAGAASFLTPIATPANMMVMGPGGYTFSDYWKLGLPLLLLFLAVATFYVPLIWQF